MTSTAWWNDFQYARGVVHVKKTGIDVPVESGVIGEVLTWLVFYGRVEAARLGRRADGPRIWFAPDRPRPWYLIWPVLQLSGLRLAKSLDDADLVFSFEDRTIGDTPVLPEGLATLNVGCVDVSKTRVAVVFEQVFGRALKLDPREHTGVMVEKSEDNGVHDGGLVEGPMAPRPGRTYQRLVDTLASDGCVEDLRCPTVDGEIPVVFIKRREAARRFANSNCEVIIRSPESVFSPVERERLKDFCRAMKLDWGGLDVLRDRHTGEIWVVDVNKTDMGPPIALSLKDKMSATRCLARALRGFAERRIAREIPA